MVHEEYYNVTLMFYEQRLDPHRQTHPLQNQAAEERGV